MEDRKASPKSADERAEVPVDCPIGWVCGWEWIWAMPLFMNANAGPRYFDSLIRYASELVVSLAILSALWPSVAVMTLHLSCTCGLCTLDASWEEGGGEGGKRGCRLAV